MTVTLHTLLMSAFLIDLWGTMFWARVGTTVGLSVAGVGTLVAVLLATILLVDLRRQWLSSRGSDVWPGPPGA